MQRRIWISDYVSAIQGLSVVANAYASALKENDVARVAHKFMSDCNASSTCTHNAEVGPKNSPWSDRAAIDDHARYLYTSLKALGGITGVSP